MREMTLEMTEKQAFTRRRRGKAVSIHVAMYRSVHEKRWQRKRERVVGNTEEREGGLEEEEEGVDR